MLLGQGNIEQVLLGQGNIEQVYVTTPTTWSDYGIISNIPHHICTYWMVPEHSIIIKQYNQCLMLCVGYMDICFSVMYIFRLN